MQWPTQRDVGRVGDMAPPEETHLRVGLDSDNDVWLEVWGDGVSASIEFCCPGIGGGKSSRTREALVALMVAIEADNAESPQHAYPPQPRVVRGYLGSTPDGGFNDGP